MLDWGATGIPNALRRALKSQDGIPFACGCVELFRSLTSAFLLALGAVQLPKVPVCGH